MDWLRRRFASFASDQLRHERLENAIKRAERKVKPPKVEKIEIDAEGSYNAVAVPVAPHHIVSVKDASKEPVSCVLFGPQQVVIEARYWVPPVSIEYVTFEEDGRWRREMEIAVREAIG